MQSSRTGDPIKSRIAGEMENTSVRRPPAEFSYRSLMMAVICGPPSSQPWRFFWGAGPHPVS